MDRAQLAEQKFRPLKKAMQQTFARLKRAVQAEIMPEQRDARELMEQVRIMISYPGFGDEAYPQFLAASTALAAASLAGDREGVQTAMHAILALQRRCHESRC